nr:hypothetical protein [Tanacetum cinerariifolium]
GNGEEDQGLRISEEERIHEEEEAYELYRDVDINQGRGLQVSQDIEDSHVTLTPFHLDGQQESSSVSSQFITSMLNPTSDVAYAMNILTDSKRATGANDSSKPIPSSCLYPLDTRRDLLRITIFSSSLVQTDEVPPALLLSKHDQPLPLNVLRFCCLM